MRSVQAKGVGQLVQLAGVRAGTSAICSKVSPMRSTDFLGICGSLKIKLNVMRVVEVYSFVCNAHC